jgi:hypothetical protein
MTMLMPPLRMGEGEPVHELGQISITPWQDDGVLVIRHDTTGQQLHRDAGTGSHQHPLRRRIVSVIVEQCSPGVRPIFLFPRAG